MCLLPKATCHKFKFGINLSKNRKIEKGVRLTNDQSSLPNPNLAKQQKWKFCALIKIFFSFLNDFKGMSKEENIYISDLS